MINIFQKFKDGLKKTTSNFSKGIKDIVVNKEIDDKTLEEIEEFLIQSDVGVEASSEIRQQIANSRIDPSKNKLDEIIERTKFGGGELVKLMGTSAWYAPGAAAAQMVESIVKNQKRIFPVCVKLDGEYGIDDCYLGVPVVLGSNGIEKVIELDLNSEEKELLEESRKHVKEVMSVLENLK